jgi:hypothetical protein
VPSDLLWQEVVMDGTRTRVDPTSGVPVAFQADPSPRFVTETTVDTRRAPIGRIVGARSGDKGGNANLGVWARTEAAYEWLESFLTTERLRKLMPETQDLEVQRYELPNIRSLNFVIVGLLGEGVASSVRLDPQAKGLGEYLRAKVVDVPVSLLEGS